MAIAHSANTNAELGSNTTTNVSHTQTGTPAGVLIFTIDADSSTSSITSVTYGGVSVPSLGSNYEAQDSAGETGFCKSWFLGGTATIPSGIPVPN